VIGARANIISQGAADIPSFDALLDLLRGRLQVADALHSSELHSFKVLIVDKANLVSDGSYWEAFEELQEQGHLHTASNLGPAATFETESVGAETMSSVTRGRD
jgi:hypothetical protein